MFHWRPPPKFAHYLYKVVRRFRGRKEGTTSSQHGAYALGYTHPTMAKNNEQQAGNGKPTSEISPQFRLRAATRPHEVGIGSNRRSAGCGEYVLGSCTHRPSSQQSWRRLNPLFLGFRNGTFICMYYVLKSHKSNALYIGYTINLRKRIDQHNHGDNQSTKPGTPWKLIYYESYLSNKDAHKRELQLKKFKSAYGFLKRRIVNSITRA